MKLIKILFKIRLPAYRQHKFLKMADQGTSTKKLPTLQDLVKIVLSAYTDPDLDNNTDLTKLAGDLKDFVQYQEEKKVSEQNDCKSTVANTLTFEQKKAEIEQVQLKSKVNLGVSLLDSVF